MNKSFFAWATLTLAGFPLLASARPTMSGVAFAALPKIDAVERAVVLYDQSANASGVATVSQNFLSLDVYDSQAADDFTVPAGKVWTITEIDFVGEYFNGPGPAKSETLTFYKDAGGKPGAVIRSETMTCADNAGSFACKLPKPKKYHGRLWISVSANLPFAGFTGGEWGWGNQSTTEGSPAMWENPGNGFATGCTAYMTETLCVPLSTGDHLFVIKGTKN